MKRLFSLLLIASCQLAIVNLLAANTVTTVTQVSNGVTLTTDVDYTVTSTTPFTSAGSIDIVNTEHAVLILKNIKPSKVLSDFMGSIYINGEAAQNDVNCQVKMYAQGAIILPYGKDFKPLTCYTEPNFGGESCNTYGLGNSGGFMNTLTAKMLNNQIRSFKLKRGYMVTFAVGTGGWGYSRCFIADKEDLELSSLPSVLDGKISSYRVFKWYDAQKKGLASNGDAGANDALNTSWCYDWGQGNDSRLPDHEWVPNHIYEDWPSAATCGGVTQSCHMKTNNEPGNSADDHPQTVDVVLGNWQNLMRTGMRLCSESSHDGSMNHLKAFIDSIDARGWRCDILDLHCYWAGNFGSLTWYSDNYGNGRPIWISEWIWGASWNNNGAFGNGVTDAQILNETKNILNTLNSNSRVERYAYWNSEGKAHLYENGSLTELGKYYASMESGMAYNKSGEYIPKVVYKAPYGVSGTYTKSKKTFDLTWSDPNGDMLDSIVVECKLPGTTKWVKRANVEPKDKNSANDISYSYSETITDPGIYYYRVQEYYNVNKSVKKFTTPEASATVAAAQAVGLLQFGELKIANTESVTTDLVPQETAPYVVVGMISNKNTANGITNQIQSLGKSSFKFRFYPWQYDTPVSINNAETAHYMVLPANQIYKLNDEMMLISYKAGNIKGDEVYVTFPEAFPEGVTPVVVAQQNTSVASYPPVTVKVYDVTNEGFKAKLVCQEKVASINAQNVNYFAASPGQIAIGGGKMLTIGRNNETPVGGTARQSVFIKNQDGDTLHLLNPYIIAASQTDRYAKASIFRLNNAESDDKGVYMLSIRRQVDGTSTVTTANNAKENGDYIGWIIISDDPNGTGDEEPVISTAIGNVINDRGFNVSVQDGAIHAFGSGIQVYTASGARVVLGQRLPAGIYIVSDGTRNVKVQVK